MKHKTVLISALLLFLLFAGGGIFMILNRSGSTASNQISVADAQRATSATDTSVQKTLKELFTSGVSQKCSFNNTTESPAVAGETYISAGKIRSDFTTEVDGKTITSHMIVDGNTNYVWTDEQNVGFKMTIDVNAAETPMPSGSAPQQQVLDMNKTMDYSCTPWIVDASLFVPPANIDFSDFSEMFKPSDDVSSVSENQTACMACDQLTGEAKTQCQTALGCE